MKTQKSMQIILEDPNSLQQIVLSIFRHGYKTIPPDHFYYVSGIFHPLAVDVVSINKNACREMLYQAKSAGWNVWIRHGKIYI
jgi:hypothetical protein